MNMNIPGLPSIDNVPSLGGTGGLGGTSGINPENQGAGAEVMNLQGKAPTQAKSLASLAPGQVFSAEILDIQQGSITLKMAEEGVLTARSLVMPDARIGDRAIFLVRENTPKQIILEFLRGQGEGQISASIIKEAVSAANMQHTPANAEIVKELISRNLPIDPQTMQRAAFFRYSMPQAPFEQIQFLLENNFAANERTVEIFNGLSTGQMSLATEIADLLAIMKQSEQIDFMAKLPAERREALEGLINQLKEFANLNLNDVGANNARAPSALSQNPNQYLQILKAISLEIAKFAKEDGNTPLARKAENINDIIEFARNITETKLYLQFPFGMVEDRQHLAQLHVFKRRGSKAKRVSGKDATAVIALDMAHLGRVEILVNKHDRNINLQFRSDKDLTLDAVSANSVQLSDMLKEKGFLLMGLKTRKITENFELTAGPESISGRAMRVPTETGTNNNEPKRYSFDVRV